MNRSVKICIIILSVIFISAVIMIFVTDRPTENNLIEISQNGEIIYTIDISEENRTIKIDSPDGGYNIIEIKDGKVRVSDADCPDKTCMKTGYLRSEGIPIVCLPHKLIIKFADERSTE